jgi:predicted nucleic acid-binding protein
MPTTISIDASVAVKAIVEEAGSGADRAIIAAREPILAPAHAYAEIAEIVLRKSLVGLVYIAAARKHGVKLVTAGLHLLRKTSGTGFSSTVIHLESFTSWP